MRNRTTELFNSNVSSHANNTEEHFSCMENRKGKKIRSMGFKTSESNEKFIWKTGPYLEGTAGAESPP